MNVSERSKPSNETAETNWKHFRALARKKWSGLMTGSVIVALILTVGATIWQGVPYLLLFFVILLICLLVAFYQVWRDEYHARLDAERHLVQEEARTSKLVRLTTLVFEGEKLCNAQPVPSSSMAILEWLTRAEAWFPAVEEFAQKAFSSHLEELRKPAAMMSFQTGTPLPGEQLKGHIAHHVAILNALKESLNC